MNAYNIAAYPLRSPAMVAATIILCIINHLDFFIAEVSVSCVL
jgi:hypothetical protein